MNATRIERSADASLAVALIAAMILALLAKQALALSDLYVFKVVLGAMSVAWLVKRGMRDDAGGHGSQGGHGARFGLANQVTLARALLVALLFGLVGEYADVRVMWSAVVIASVASASDALDGWIARRTATASDFGARFDMETDAALIAVLAILVWYWQRAGMWVLLAGAARYAFVLGTWACAWMRPVLPPSVRRKALCVAQIVTLVVCMAPLLTPAVTTLIAAAGVVALLGSFIIDTLWLARAAHHSPKGEETC